MRKPKLILLIACLVVVGSINARAKEVVIYISGPWVYVPSANRVVVFVPVSHNHLSPQIFPGDYTQSSGKPILYQGLYKLDLPQGLSGGCTNKSNPYRLQENLGITIGDTSIQDEVVKHKNAARIAVSLPKPACYISSHTSESKVGTGPNTLVQAEYTTLMELHYFVDDGPARLSGTSDDQTVTLNDDIAFLTTTGNPPAISLVMMAVDTNSERQCDSYSHESLDFSRLSLALDGKLFAQFPELKADGSGQNKGKYNSCPKVTIDRNDLRMKAAIDILDNVRRIRAYIADPKATSADPGKSLEVVKKDVKAIFGKDVPQAITSEIKKASDTIESIEDSRQKRKEEQKVTGYSGDLVFERTDGIVWPFTVGGGDCHMAQISVNSVIPK